MKIKESTRYIVVDKTGKVLYQYPWGARLGTWDFTLPSEHQGGNILDLHVHPELREKYDNQA